MDLPNAKSHKDVTKKGYLHKLTARSFPYIPHPWKRKYCLLVKGSLYYYEKEDSKGIDKGSGVINLEYYDQVIEATAKESKKASHVFVLTSQDRSFFDPGRHLFSADTEKDMQDWIRILKKAVELTRNNVRINSSVAKLAVASSPRVAKSSPQKGAKGEHEGEERTEEKKRKKRENYEEKENLDDWTESGDKSKSTEASQRRRRANPSSQSVDEGSSPITADSGTGSIGRKKEEGDERPTSSLGRKGKAKGGSSQGAKQEFKYAHGDLEGMMFGSLGRQLKTDRNKSSKGISEDSGESSGNMERRKRKAEDDEGEDILESPSSGPQLESVTKHRVKGPPGRRMPQNRRTHQLMMKHRASSLSALAHNGVNVENAEEGGENANTPSFIPWLNRSLDLLEDPATYVPTRHSQPAYGAFLQSDLEDEPEEMFEYNIGFNEDSNMNLYVQQASGDSYSNMNVSNTSNQGAPPLPPRMESRDEYVQGLQQLQQQQIQQQFHQQQLQHLQSSNQMLSPFGTALQNPRQRRSVAVDEMNSALMTRSMNNDLFIASFSDGDNSGDLLGSQTRKGKDATNSSGSSPGQIQRPQQPMKSKQANAKLNQMKATKKSSMMSQPEIGRFNVAVRNLQKHVVELDQAVSGITKEVEDSKVDLNSVKSGLVGLKKEKERLSDSVSIVAQEATRLKEQVASTLKETEKLQKTATSALVVAEKAKVDQQNLRKEYEGMILDLKATIDKIKKEAADGLGFGRRLAYEEESDENNDKEVEVQEEKGSRGRKKKRDSSQGRQGSSKQSFFSRPSSIISGLTNRSSLSKSSSMHETEGKENNKNSDESPKSGKKGGKERSVSRNKGKKGAAQISRQMSDDFPMMDETASPRTLSPIGSDQDLSDADFAQNDNFNLGKSVSSPSVASRPKVLNLKSQQSISQKQTSGLQVSPDSPTRPVSPFDVPRFHLNGRATSPSRVVLHRPGSTPGPLSRQGSMTTVPEDRAIDLRQTDNRPSDPPPPPPTKPGVFAISRQNSTPNISTQKSNAQANLQRQHSLGVVLEENKSISRQSSLMSVPDARLIVDRTLPMSPTPSLISFPGSWSTTSLNRQDSEIQGLDAEDNIATVTSPKDIRMRGPVDQVAGGILSGSSNFARPVAPLDENGDELPLATSSLKRRKKVKKDPIMI